MWNVVPSFKRRVLSIANIWAHVEHLKRLFISLSIVRMVKSERLMGQVVREFYWTDFSE
jgi:hypothetical protein